MSTYLLASNNAGKLREFREIFQEDTILSLKDVSLDVEVEEDGATFEENAVKKASEIAKLSGMTAIADDSGLCVDALQGAPGVYSARYAGEDATDKERIEKLLEEMKDEENRGARFVSVVALCTPEGEIVTARGECEGEILHQPLGQGGFGYDPVFYVKEFDKTFGQLTGEEKNSISHRGRAIRVLKEKLQ
ncbi:MAG: XTP/dITP diphosphatase [Ruminococcaceae bacterium]|nr:XTP/dITP diphosphatase [Oscillospiraceae bacterium]